MKGLLRRLIRYSIIIAFAAAAVTFVISLLLAKDSGREFWSGFLLNVAAELLGVALTVWGATIVASKKLDELTPRFVNLIAHLRKVDKIDSETARGAVICVVEVLSEDRLQRTRPSLSVFTREQHCRVCRDSFEVEKVKGIERCKNCGLKSEVWKQP